MTDTEKLELRRKTCEALGWAIVREGEYTLLNEPTGRLIYRLWGPDRELELFEKAPAIESDNGLALDALVKLKQERKVDYWELEQIGDSTICRIKVPDIPRPIGRNDKAVSIAICLTICAVLKREQAHA